jgi:hypothetical protein
MSISTIASSATATAESFFSGPFDMAYDSPLDMPSSFLDAKDDASEITLVPMPSAVSSAATTSASSANGFDWADGTTTLDPAAWEYWVWYEHVDGAGRAYYYNPHYDISQYEVPVSEGPVDEYEQVDIRSKGVVVWQKHYRIISAFPHYEPYYYNSSTGETCREMPTQGYVQVVRFYDTVDEKRVHRNYTSVQFPKLPPLNIQQAK